MSGEGGLVGGAAGAALFFAMGLPPSAGWTMGSMVGGVLAPGRSRGNGPRQADLRPQAVNYGQPIPIVYGHTALAGTVIWAMPLIAESGDSLGKGGSTSGTYSYYANFAVALCEGVHHIGRIWAGQQRRLIYDGVKPVVYPGEWSVTCYQGTETQPPDPLIESDKGVGQTPAYRGTVYAVFNHYPLKDDGNMIPQLWFEIAGVTDNGDCPLPCTGFPTNTVFTDTFSAAGYAPWTEYEETADRFWSFSTDGSGTVQLFDATALTKGTIFVSTGDGHFGRARYSRNDNKMWIVNGSRVLRLDCASQAPDIFIDLGTGWTTCPQPNDMAVDRVTGDMWVLASQGGAGRILQFSASTKAMVGTGTAVGAGAGNLIVDTAHRCWFNQIAVKTPATLTAPEVRDNDKLLYIVAGTNAVHDDSLNYFCCEATGDYVSILRTSYDWTRNALWMWITVTHRQPTSATTYTETLKGCFLIRYDLSDNLLRIVKHVAFGTDYLFGYDVLTDGLWFRQGNQLQFYCGDNGHLIHDTTIPVPSLGDRSIPLVRRAGVTGENEIYFDEPGGTYKLGQYNWDQISKNGDITTTVTIVANPWVVSPPATIPDNYEWQAWAFFNRNRNTVSHVMYQGFYRNAIVREYDCATGAATGTVWTFPDNGANGTITQANGQFSSYDHVHDLIWTYNYTHGSATDSGVWNAYKWDGTLLKTVTAFPVSHVTVWWDWDHETGDWWVSWYTVDPTAAEAVPINCYLDRRDGADFSLLERWDTAGMSAKYLSITAAGDCYFTLNDGGFTAGILYAGSHAYYVRKCTGNTSDTGVVGAVHSAGIPNNISAMTYDSIHNALWCWNSDNAESEIYRWDLTTQSIGTRCPGATGRSHYGFAFQFDDVNNVFWLRIENPVTGDITSGLTALDVNTTPNTPQNTPLVGYCGTDGHLIHLVWGADTDGTFDPHVIGDSWHCQKTLGASIFFRGTLLNSDGTVISGTQGPNLPIVEYHWDVAERPIIHDKVVTLGEIVADISYRVNLTPSNIDVSQLTDIVDGYQIAKQTPARDAIEVLRPVWYFDPVESEGKVKFVKRGGPVMVIPDDDLAAHADSEQLPDSRVVLRQMPQDLPFRITVMYVQPATKYQPATKFQQRYRNVSGAIDSTMDTTITMTDTKAQEVADVNLYVAWTERTHISFALPAKKYATVEPTDNVQVGGYTCRIVKVTYNLAGVIACDALLEDNTYYGDRQPQVTETPDASGLIKVIPTTVTTF
jgi:hypothetical protein